MEKRPVDFAVLRTMLEPCMENVFFREKGIEIHVEPPRFPLGFEADRYLADRVLQNLLMNAAMYTPERGEVRISFEPPATVRVFNSGVPIPERYRGDMFGKYAHVAGGGSRYSKGLGLFFCKLVMEAHGGAIRLECTEKGNCFVLDFGGMNGGADAISS